MSTTTRSRAAGDPGRRLTSHAGGALTALFALGLLCCTTLTSTFAAASTRSPCSRFSTASARCANTLVIARASNSEGEEGEEEEREGAAESEAVASTEAEAEEAGSGAVGSPSDRASSRGVVVLSRLTLTARAMAALKHGHPSASAVGFSFTLSAPAKVRVTLVKQASVHGYKQWASLPDSLTVTVGKGRASHNLTGRNKLSPGRYRLTVKPAMGRPRSIYLNALQ
jgi:hypothetical protein